MDATTQQILRRTLILSRHLSISENNVRVPPPLRASNTSTAEEIQQNFSLREYLVGADDAAFKALDFLCCQGHATKLVSEFPLVHPFEEVQPRGWCCVAEDKTGSMVGIARSYVYSCMVNGQTSSVSYAFLLRVHPYYRRQNLALWLTTQLFFHDVQENDVDYMTSWVVTDNLSSLGLQDKIAEEARTKHGMPAPELIGNFRCVGQTADEILEKIHQNNTRSSYQIEEEVDPEVVNAKKQEIKEDLNSADDDVEKEVVNITIGDMDCEIKQVNSLQEECELIELMHGNNQFFPSDVETLVKSLFHLGTFVVTDKKTNKVLGGLHAWNSGAIRITSLRDSEFRADDAALLYNPFWVREMEDLSPLICSTLLSHATNSLRRAGFKYIYCFFPDAHPTLSTISEKATISVPWRARIWYVTNQTKVTVPDDSSIFYDPRQCLI